MTGVCKSKSKPSISRTETMVGFHFHLESPHTHSMAVVPASKRRIRPGTCYVDGISFQSEIIVWVQDLASILYFGQLGLDFLNPCPPTTLFLTRSWTWSCPRHVNPIHHLAQSFIKPGCQNSPLPSTCLTAVMVTARWRVTASSRVSMNGTTRPSRTSTIS